MLEFGQMCFNLDHALNAIIRLPDLASFGQNLENLAKELKNAQVNHRFDISPDASRTISSSLDKIDEIVGNLSNPNVNFHFDQLQEIIEVLKKIGYVCNFTREISF